MADETLSPGMPGGIGSGPPDDGDNPGDEREDENEAPVRAADDRTETPEEFEELDDNDEVDRRRVGIVEALGSGRPPGNAGAVESQADLTDEEDLDADDGLEADDELRGDDEDDSDPEKDDDGSVDDPAEGDS